MVETSNLIEPGCQISLFFSLALSDGKLIDSNFDGKPASFRLGDGNMLPGFEEVLLGHSAGSQIEVLLEPEQAFGAVNPKNLQKFPIAKFETLLQDELLPTEVGSVVSFKDAGGFDLPGIVSAIRKASIAVDFNHPLAGKQILFKASIVAVLPPNVDTVEIKL